MKKTELQKALLAYRKRHFLSQPGAAERLGMSVWTLRKYEQGTSKPHRLAETTMLKMLES